jgi:hypothetical protein
MMASGSGDDEIERRARFLANEISDKRVEAMAYRDDVKLAVLENELKHVREAQDHAAELLVNQQREFNIKFEAMQAQMLSMQKNYQELKDVLTKASGVKVAFMALLAGFGFLVNQFWHYLASRP